MVWQSCPSAAADAAIFTGGSSIVRYMCMDTHMVASTCSTFTKFRGFRGTAEPLLDPPLLRRQSGHRYTVATVEN